jgi:hypothetical protein
MQYICKNCKKDFKQKSHYSNHINRKIPCKGKIKQDIVKLVDHQDITKLVDPQPHAQIHSMPQNIISQLIVSIPNNTTIDNAKHNSDELNKPTVDDIKDSIEIDNAKKSTTKYTCPNCFIILSRSDVLNKHLKKHCKMVKEDNKKNICNKQLLQELFNEIKAMKDENKEIKEENKKLANHIK